MSITASTFARVFQDPETITRADKSIATSIKSYDRNAVTVFLQFLGAIFTLGLGTAAVELYRNGIKDRKVDDFKQLASQILDQLTQACSNITLNDPYNHSTTIEINGQEMQIKSSEFDFKLTLGGVTKSLRGMTFEKAQKKLILDILLNKDMYLPDTYVKALNMVAPLVRANVSLTVGKHEFIQGYFVDIAFLTADDVNTICGDSVSSYANENYNFDEMSVEEQRQ